MNNSGMMPHEQENTGMLRTARKMQIMTKGMCFFVALTIVEMVDEVLRGVNKGIFGSVFEQREERHFGTI